MEDDPFVRESNPGRTRVVRGGLDGRIFFKPHLHRAYAIRGCIFFATAVGDAGTRLKKKPEHRVEKLHPCVCLHQSAVAADAAAAASATATTWCAWSLN